jgi:hypothetical protein
MWFPSAKLVMPKQRFNENEKVLYIDKDGNEHNAKVLSVRFKSLNTGYIYGIETEEPVNGNSKFLVKEKNLNRAEVEVKEKKTKKNKTQA